jgi:hypothetical protein
MKLVKTSAIAVAISALIAGPVLAQGASDAPARGGAMGKTQMQQGGAAGSMDADAPAGGTHKAAKTGAKTTVGAGSGAKGTATTPPASR